ncbi:DUF3515 domain-containing protein [Mycolicibacterium tusciae]|uniref:DUF3515 domain-containing protein n=1 Tax=Mycolicibacterium tusciae TaxID=75922 RepID=UPI00024A42BA|nr:DUF3515 domain-containing protein [Mycolicibacterium tusciae]
MDTETRDGPPRALMIAAVVVAVAAVVSVLVVAALRQTPATDRPVAIVSVPAPQADSADCATLVDALPEQLGDLQRAPAADPAPPAVAAWRTTEDGEPVILRCGLDRPAEFVLGSPLQVVDAVSWFRVGEAGAGETGAGEDSGADQGRSTWFAVDRPVYVALTLPAGAGPTPIQEISRLIAKTLPAKAVDPAPVG